jgi:hypothetical protein
MLYSPFLLLSFFPGSLSRRNDAKTCNFFSGQIIYGGNP